MNSLSKNLVALGATGAMALGTVVCVGAIAPASAATSTYNCTTSLGSVLSIPVSMANPFNGTYAAGDAVGAREVLMNATLTPSVLGVIAFLLPGASSIAGTIEDASMKVGSQSVPLSGLAAPATSINPSGTTLPVGGATAPFAAVSGVQRVMAPESFTFVPAGLPLELPCTIAQATQLGTMDVSGSDAAEKAASTTVANLRNAPVTKSEHAKIRVKVRTGGDAASGTVIAKQGTKVLRKATLNDNGNKTLKLPRLSKGIHKIVIKYKGNATTKASRDVVKFKVRRG